MYIVSEEDRMHAVHSFIHDKKLGYVTEQWLISNLNTIIFVFQLSLASYLTGICFNVH